MTTQGARKPKPLPPKPAPANDFSLSEWMTKRGLVGEKRMEVGGEWFRFTKAATSPQLAAFADARGKGDLFGVMAALLVDPSEKQQLETAFQRQPQPIDAKQEQEYLMAIVNFLVAGDAGESSAS